jgi:hypothetical protein
MTINMIENQEMEATVVSKEHILVRRRSKGGYDAGALQNTVDRSIC